MTAATITFFESLLAETGAMYQKIEKAAERRSIKTTILGMHDAGDRWPLSVNLMPEGGRLYEANRSTYSGLLPKLALFSLVQSLQ